MFQRTNRLYPSFGINPFLKRKILKEIVIYFRSLWIIIRYESSSVILVALIISRLSLHVAPPKLHSRSSRNFHTKQNYPPAVGVFSTMSPIHLIKSASENFYVLLFPFNFAIVAAIEYLVFNNCYKNIEGLEVFYEVL